MNARGNISMDEMGSKGIPKKEDRDEDMPCSLSTLSIFCASPSSLEPALVDSTLGLELDHAKNFSTKSKSIWFNSVIRYPVN